MSGRKKEKHQFPAFALFVLAAGTAHGSQEGTCSPDDHVPVSPASSEPPV